MASRLLLIGHGRMGRVVDALSREYHFEVVGRIDVPNGTHAEALSIDRIPSADVAVDFSTAAAVVENLPKIAALGLNVVIGTTGWANHEAQLKQIAHDAQIGVVAAPNCSLGVMLFQAIVEHAASLFAGRPEYGAWLHEQHHAGKRDAPSGTAKALIETMVGAGYGERIDVASTRAGSIPGTHSVGFDGPFEGVTLTHAARDRATFARGALEAARWVIGRRGWFTMQDVLGLSRHQTGV